MNTSVIFRTQLEEFDISPERGFLPAEDPLRVFLAHPRYFSAAERAYIDALSECARKLPEWLASGRIRQELEKCLKDFTDTQCAQTIVEKAGPRERAWLMRTLSFLSSAWVWGGIDEGHTDRIPAFLAKPLCTIACAVSRHPILSYDSYGPENWYRIDPKGPIALGNLGVIQNFLGDSDENWFILVHVEIESEAGPIPLYALSVLKALVQGNHETAGVCLDGIQMCLHKVNAVMRRMPEGCDPHIYFDRVRPYIHGSKNNPALPNGVIYEGCFGKVPQKFYGETGAQSAIFPTLYAFLGVHFTNDIYLQYLHEMREYMPSGHRQFIAFLEDAEQSGFSLMTAVKEGKVPHGAEQVRDILSLMIEFLETHYLYAASYIQSQAQRSVANPTHTGTGGTPYMRYLKEHIDRLKEMRKSI